MGILQQLQFIVHLKYRHYSPLISFNRGGLSMSQRLFRRPWCDRIIAPCDAKEATRITIGKMKYSRFDLHMIATDMDKYLNFCMWYYHIS